MLQAVAPQPGFRPFLGSKKLDFGFAMTGSFDPDQLISTARLAQLFDLTPRRIQQLEKQGVLTKRRHGAYELGPTVRAYCDHVVEKIRAKAGRHSGAGDQLIVERTRKLRRENDERENQLIPTEDAITTLRFMVAVLKHELAKLPAKFTDRPELQRALDCEVSFLVEDIDTRLDMAINALRSGGDPAELY